MEIKKIPPAVLFEGFVDGGWVETLSGMRFRIALEEDTLELDGEKVTFTLSVPLWGRRPWADHIIPVL